MRAISPDDQEIIVDGEMSAVIEVPDPQVVDSSDDDSETERERQVAADAAIAAALARGARLLPDRAGKDRSNLRVAESSSLARWLQAK